ncbi:hypothetical protein QA612_06465 [Evansella sp. AB-P1]|uniref:hypothetical protein n=1 Tax=Evansella sp. AB-P1 TaxID=3037653 RepID=UPI00241FDE2E|nr:hypothetical protein [Evansella sp. AB-P1]MDG5787130.1 hypothetical protein [Evansella sp. AB-P1]
MKRYAFYYYGKTESLLDYYFITLHFFAMKELHLELNTCVLYSDTDDFYTGGMQLVNNIHNFDCLVVPSLKHFRDYDEICIALSDNGIEIIEALKEDTSFEY